MIIYCLKCQDDKEHELKDHNSATLWTCTCCGRTNDFDYDELNPEFDYGFHHGHFVTYS